MTNAKPLLSIVIPTHRRPQYLSRAIDSALQAAPDGDVEVIVVPNGPDDSWKPITSLYEETPQVKWHNITIAHANIARNHGLSISRGKYIRFLDDDDYLFPEAAEQIAILEKTKDETCSGRIENIDENGVRYGLLSSPNTDDFICAAVSFSGFALPTSHVYLRSSLTNCLWDSQLNRRQDYAWMLDLAAAREWKWSHLDIAVGAWFQHRGTRISQNHSSAEHDRPVVDKLLALHATLIQSGRSDEKRKAAIAEALWHHVHVGFPNKPCYWTRIARFAQEINKNSRPPNILFTTQAIRTINPIVGEWALLPARKISAILKNLLSGYRDNDHVRRL